MDKSSRNNKEVRNLRAQAAALLEIRTEPAVAAADQDEPQKQKVP
jgi:hypothetical protein